MTSCEPKSDRKKRKSTQVSNALDALVINNDNDDNDDVQSLRETKARRVSTDAATLTTLAAYQNVTSPVTAHADALGTISSSQRREASTQTSSRFNSTAQKCDTGNENASRSITQHEESLERIGKLIQYLFHSNLVKVNAALDALFMDLSAADDDDDDDSSCSSSKKCETIIAVGGVHALVLLVDKSLALAVTKFKSYESADSNSNLPPDQVTLVDGVVELETLDRTLDVIINLTLQNETSRSSISAIAGVEAIVNVMKTFPKCRQLQWSACHALRNLTMTTTYSSSSGSSYNMNVGKKSLLQEDGIKLLLATVNNHLDSSYVCQNALGALENIIVTGSYQENIRRFIQKGGGAALAVVREEWPYDDDVQPLVRTLAKLVVDEMKTWVEEVE
jgi:hypothetical protein